LSEDAEATDKHQRCAIAIMAKAPSAGQVKTRLQPLLSPDEARDLGCCFLTDLTANLALAARAARIDPYIAFAPAGSEPAFASIVEPGTRFVLADGSLRAPPPVAGFGHCLHQAMHALFAAGYGAVALLNADGPTLATSIIEEAASLISRPIDRVILGPSFDGGYYLIAMRRLHAGVFGDIDWSTDRVAAQTRQRAQALGLDVIDLETWDDVDDPPSLRRLVEDLHGVGRKPGRHIPYPAPVTMRWLRDHGVLARLGGASPRDAPAGCVPQDR
jgi:rSAM/selenodomain-associated transferase 1